MTVIMCALLLCALSASHIGKVMVVAAGLERPLLGRLSSGLEDDSNSKSAAPLTSALGDPGMRSDRVRVGVEGWNFCNRAGNVSVGTNIGISNSTVTPISRLSSPRWADCTDLSCPPFAPEAPCTPVYRVSKSDNNLGPGEEFPGGAFGNYTDPDSYAIAKEKYLGSLCAGDTGSPSWSFWMIMLKNGNFDVNSGLCPMAMESNSSASERTTVEHFQFPSHTGRKLMGNNDGFPCFGPGCMNQPVMFHNSSQPQGVNSGSNSSPLQAQNVTLAGGFYGTYDVDAALSVIAESRSFFSVNWSKDKSGDSWNFHHVLRVSEKYPWLMLYLRADATSGLSGGYPWDTRGMMVQVPESPNFKVEFTLNVLSGGGPASQFYLMDIGGCWKNNGEQCDGDLASDVTRYSEMIINPDTPAWCRPDMLYMCPPYHTTANGTRIHRNDTANYPYSAYHLYCVPYNARYPEEPFQGCDPYSNPQPQELLQLLPHPEWAANGYPAAKGDGWIGDPRTWELDVGALSSRLFFYQDPGTAPAIRKWPSLDIGTEIFISNQPETAEWIVSDLNVLVPSSG